jgi:hypothetical protein
MNLRAANQSLGRLLASISARFGLTKYSLEAVARWLEPRADEELSGEVILALRKFWDVCDSFVSIPGALMYCMRGEAGLSDRIPTLLV